MSTQPGQLHVAIPGENGAISPLGLTVDELWGNLAAGLSGVARIIQFDASVLPCQIAGEVKDYDPRHYLDAKDARRMSRCAQFVMAATQEAIKDAGLGARFADPERAAVVLGTGIGGVEKIGEALDVQRQRGYDKLNPFLLPAMLGNLPGHHVSKPIRRSGRCRPSSRLAPPARKPSARPPN